MKKRGKILALAAIVVVGAVVLSRCGHKNTFLSGLLAFFASSFHFNPSAAFFQYRKQKTAARLVIKHHAAEHARHRIAAQNSVILPEQKPVPK